MKIILNHFALKLNERFENSVNKWFSFDDLKGVYKELKNQYLTIDYIWSSEAICLLIYLKIK